jgi:two-component system sensor histidine kinase DesK
MSLSPSMPPSAEARPGDGLPWVVCPRLLGLAVLFTAQVSAILTGSMPPARLVASLTSVTVVTALHASYFRLTARWPRRARLGILAGQGIATYLPLLAAGDTWPGMGGFLASSVLLVVSGWAAWALSAATIVGLFVAAVILGPGVHDAGNTAVTSLTVCLVMYGVGQLTAAVRRVYARQTEVAQHAVIRERLRFGRDMHDLLGCSLAAITLRAELARRLMNSDPVRAGDELRDVVDIARRSVAEVRQVADGYRNISLAQEVAAAASLLASANVTTQVAMNCGVLPDKIDGVLAIVLRELITNLLRHSSARNCWISAEQDDEHVRLSVVNDRVPRTAATRRDGGGLENLAWRLEAIGGTLCVTVGGDGRFRVLAEIAINADVGPSARQHRTGCGT